MGFWHQPRAQGLSAGLTAPCWTLTPSSHDGYTWAAALQGSACLLKCLSPINPSPTPNIHTHTHTQTPISIHLLRAFSATLPVPSVDMTPSVQPLPTPPASPPVKMKIALIMSSILLHPLTPGANLYYKTLQSIICFLGTGSSVCSLRDQQAIFLA